MTTKEFWRWFLAREHELWNLIDARDPRLEQLQSAVTSYQEGLRVEVSDRTDNKREMIISAGGNGALFKKVDDLIAAAPTLDRWTLTALRPPRGFNFVLDTRVGRYDPSTIVFEPLSSDGRPSAIGIRAYVPIKDLGTDAKEAIALMVETGLGERARAVIAHLEVAPLTTPAEEHIPLGDLPEYLDWFKRKTS
jgi:hypothetical protein